MAESTNASFGRVSCCGNKSLVNLYWPLKQLELQLSTTECCLAKRKENTSSGYQDECSLKMGGATLFSEPRVKRSSRIP